MINTLNSNLEEKLHTFNSNYTKLKKDFSLENLEILINSIYCIKPYIETIYNLEENINKILGEHIIKELNNITDKLTTVSNLEKSNIFLKESFSEYYFIIKSSEILLNYENYLNLETRYFIDNYNIDFLINNINKSYSNISLLDNNISRKICFKIIKIIKTLQYLINFINVENFDTFDSIINNINQLLYYLKLMNSIDDNFDIQDFILTINSFINNHAFLLNNLLLVKSLHLVEYKEKVSTLEFFKNNIKKLFNENKNFTNEIKFIVEIEKKIYVYLESNEKKTQGSMSF